MIAEAWIVTVGLVLGRVGTMLALAPIYGMMGMPRWATALLALGCSAIVAGNLEPVALDGGLGSLVVALLGEVAAGVALGMGVAATFSALAFGAEIAAAQAGYSVATLIDPLNRASETALGALGGWLAGLVFVAMGLHGRCIEIVARSFELVPVGAVALPHAGAGWAVARVAACTALGVQLSAPVLAGVWLIHLFIALLSKLAPRMHAFFSVGTTVTGAAGLALLAVSLPWMMAVHRDHLAAAVDGALRLAPIGR